MKTIDTYQFSFFLIQLFQFVFFIFHSLLYRKKEYFYYTLYILSSILYIIGLTNFSNGFNELVLNKSNFLLYLDKPMAFVSYFLYFKFAKYFLDIPITHPAFAKKIRFIEYTFLFFAFSLILSTTFLNASTNEFIFSIYSVISIPLAFYSIISFVKIGSKGLNYFIISGASLIIFAAISTFVLVKLQRSFPIEFNYPIFLHYHLLIILELLIFSIGLGYKAYKMEFEKRKLDVLLISELLEKEQIQHNLVEVREKISRDIHDDIGASLSGIKILADLSYTKNDDKNVHEIGIISADLMLKLREAMWFLKSNDDTLNGLVTQLEKEWKTILCAKNMTIHFNLNEGTAKISILQKKNLYLICKEAIHNCIKHSESDTIIIDFSLSGRMLKLCISDNGSYKTPTNTIEGNGLRNMNSRIKELNGWMSMNLHPSKSVELICEIPL